MIRVEDWQASDSDFGEIARIQNLVKFDMVDDPDELKLDWHNRDTSVLSQKLFLDLDGKKIGVIHFTQGSGQKKNIYYFNMYLDPVYDGCNYRRKLYDEMLERLTKIGCTRLFPWAWDHDNFKSYIRFLERNDFKVVQRYREYKLDVNKADITPCEYHLKKITENGISIFDSRDEMQEFPDHYEKLEALIWEYVQDEPIQPGDTYVRDPFKQWYKNHKNYEENFYGVELVAVKKGEYIGSTDLRVNHKSEPFRAYTTGTGVKRAYRRQGIATALKIKAIERLKEKGIKEIRAGNEENNPMYKINEKLGFIASPASIEFRKDL